MAPSAITRSSANEDASDDVDAMDSSPRQYSDDSIGEHITSHEEVYTNAYTHGYTAGYIHGKGPPEKMPIAIIGMSCRLPGDVTTPAEFWELCSRARSGWSVIPKERFENASFHHPNPGKNGCFNAIGGNFLKEDLGLFDAPFFSLTAQEATSMDPQQRILLECTFEALDSAGIPKHQIVGKEVGVFIGGSFSEYESQLFADTDSIPMHQATGCAFAMQSNRLSHFFDLRGPSFTMDTACSSSLVALHQACQSLRNGESESAIVGGCHLNMLPESWISMSKSRLFSDEGRSFSFDSRGTGYGRGEGCGIVILKPLDQALKDNDIIRSVIVASGVNQDGKTPGITMPNGSAQETLMKSVYQAAGLDPKETGYVEAHGTGTKVGDPIEAAALHGVFSGDRSVRNPLFIGSVKSNIGHLEAASGIVSVIKTAMMLERGFILPNYDFKKPNENIPFSKWHLKVPISQRPWPRPKRFASVNNFGFGGTNAHVVMERAPFLAEYDAEPDQYVQQSRKLFVLSANDKSALEDMMKNLGIYLEQRPEVFQNDLMSNVAYTLGQRRSLMQWRMAIPSISSIDLIETLNGGKISPVRETEPPRIGFIFTGQGAQWNAMGRELYERYPVFASTIDACDRFLVSLNAPFSLYAELRKDSATSLINEAHISQPACTAIQLALTDLLRAWGVSPTAVAGHSSGEIGAAYAAGILSLESCMAISYHRGMAVIDFRKNHPGMKGSMMAVGCTAEEVGPLIAQLATGNVKIACFNSPTSLTISGDEVAIDELQKVLEEKQIFNRKLQIDVAYHSHHMNLAAKYYRKTLESLAHPKLTSVKFHSSLLGHVVKGSQLEPSYWVHNLTQSVRFSEALTSMCAPTDSHKTGVNMIVEIGPHSALAGPVKQILKACGPDALKISYASVLIRNRDAIETALDLASTFFLKGMILDLGAINFPIPGKQPTLLVDMPRYPWNHKTRYWHESRMMQYHKNRPMPRNDLIGCLANYSNDMEPTWRNLLRIDDIPWLRHHQIQSLTLFPMSGFLSMAIEAASQRAALRNIQYDDFELRDVSISTPLVIADDNIEMTLQLRPHQEDILVASNAWEEFRIHSWTTKKGWTEHCRGHIAVKSIAESSVSRLQSDSHQILNSEMGLVDKTKLYDSLSDLGVSYGPSFQGMNDCQANNSCSVAKITAVDTAHEMPNAFQTNMTIHPAFLEQLIEMYWPILGAGRTHLDTVYLPSAIRHMVISRRITELTKMAGNSLLAFCNASPALAHPKSFQASMLATTTGDTKEALIKVDLLTVSPILENSGSCETEPHRELCYKFDWEPILESSQLNGIPTGTSKHSNGVTNETPNGVLLNGSSSGSKNFHVLPVEDVAIIRGYSEGQICLASKLADALEHLSGKRPAISTLSDSKTKGALCVFLAEIENPLLTSLTPVQFETLQSILMNAQGTFWVVRGAYIDSMNPDANMIMGLSRSLRSETSQKFATLDLDAEAVLSETGTIEAILKVFKATFAPEASPNCELEFMERKGCFFTPRIINDAEMNAYVHKQTKGSILEPRKFAQDGRELKMVIGTPGKLETLHFVDQSMEEHLSDDEVEIEVKAIGLNSRDALAAMGQLDHLDFGFECSGVVTKTGRCVTEYVVGSRISGISVSSGVFSTYARMKAAYCFKIHDQTTFESAASVPMAYYTAHYSLFDLGRLQADDSLLIHGADIAAGSAAISLAQMVGADLFVTVCSVEAGETLKRAYGLADNQILSIHNIQAHKKKDGFDLVLNCLSTDSDILRALWNSVGRFGRFIEIEKQGANSRLQTSDLQNNRSFMSVELMSLATERPKVMKRLIRDISQLFSEGKIRPIAQTTVFPISDVETAFRLLQSGKFEGKLIVSLQPEDVVKATPSKTHTILRPDASYILIGGTGGLGRSMARWMVSKGARNLVLVSRNGSATAKVKELVEDLGAIGAQVVVRRCDVSDSASVQQLITSELVGMPEVRGVVHGAMVLRDVLFEKMTYEQYTAVIKAKVRGAWNFHNALKSNSLDFFVAISSAAGAVGNRGQAAYSAANTFLNAFVQYRINLGLAASSIDLTAVSDAGYLAENAEAAAEVSRNLGSDTICEAEVLALLGAAVDGRLARSCNSHTITGMRITSPAPFWTPDAKFKHLRIAAEANDCSSDNDSSISFNVALKASRSLEEAQDVVCRGLLSKLPSVLMLDAEDMDVKKSLSNYALDSLVAIEVRNYITREFEANLQVLELLSSGSIESLAKTVCTKSKLVSF